MKVFSAVCKLLSTLIVIALLALAAVFIVPTALGYTGYAVISGSMVPAIPVGSIVYDKDVEDASTLEVGDIITYQLDSGDMVTHRITANDVDAQTVTTKGDANDVEDASPVSYDKIIGKVAISFPFLGYVAIYGKTQLGIAAVCGVIVVLIILIYLPDALRSADDDEKKKKKHKNEIDS